MRLLEQVVLDEPERARLTQQTRAQLVLVAAREIRERQQRLEVLERRVIDVQQREQRLEHLIRLYNESQLKYCKVQY